MTKRDDGKKIMRGLRDAIDMGRTQHASDCATNNGPALARGQCDCGVARMSDRYKSRNHEARSAVRAYGAEVRRHLESEIAEPKCERCRELRDELVNARLVAKDLMEQLEASKR